MHPYRLAALALPLSLLLGGCGGETADSAQDSSADADTDTDTDTDADADADADTDADSDSDSDTDTGHGPTGDTGPTGGTTVPTLPGNLVSFATWGEYAYDVPPTVTKLTIRADGAGGGGLDAVPFGSGRGGSGGHIEATLTVVPGDHLVVIVGRGGWGAACGGAAPGAGGGGFSGVLSAAYDPLVVAGAGGGGAEGGDGCSAGAGCMNPAYGMPGDGFGAGGAQSDVSATDGRAGDPAPALTGGMVGTANCGNATGSGGYGGGGGGGGTHNGFGGGGGGGGFPGGAGGLASGGHDGNPFLAPAATLVSSAVGGAGGAIGLNGADGYVEIAY